MENFFGKNDENKSFRALQPDEIRHDDTFKTGPDLWFTHLASRHIAGRATINCTQLTTEAKQKVISLPAHIAGNQQHPTTAAPATTGATRIPSAVSFRSGQDHDPVESDRFMRIFCSFPEKVLGDSATTTRRKTRTKIITLKRMVHHITTSHHPESGAELRYLRVRLGHKRSKMTEIYTHVTDKSFQKIKSPFRRFVKFI